MKLSHLGSCCSPNSHSYVQQLQWQSKTPSECKWTILRWVGEALASHAFLSTGSQNTLLMIHRCSHCSHPWEGWSHVDRSKVMSDLLRLLRLEAGLLMWEGEAWLGMDKDCGRMLWLMDTASHRSLEVWTVGDLKKSPISLCNKTTL